MSKQSIFGRVTQLARANINALLDSAEDPEKMLDQMVRDYTDNIAEAKDAVGTTIGNLRLMEQDYAEDESVAAEWGQKAKAASDQADRMRGSADIAGAEKFDNLAKVALSRQIDSEGDMRTAKPNIDAQREVVEKLKAGLQSMESKLDELKNKRNELVARAKSAQAQSQVQDAVKNIDITDPTSEVSRFEDKIRREEARVRGQQELAASSLDVQFEELDGSAEQSEIEARLALLKSS
jgi:phage shock protein A